jgi:hypothetical protein
MKIEFLNKKEAQDYFKEMDEYAIHLKENDLEIMGFQTKEEYFQNFKSNFTNFSSLEKIKYKRLLNKVKHINITIKLIKIKSTHILDITQTRKNAIILPDKTKKTESLLVHEVFHILSRNYDFSELYKLIGFKKCSPENISDPNSVINPDCVLNNYYINLKINNENKDVIPYLAIPFDMKLKVKGKEEYYHVRNSNFQEVIDLTSYLSHPEEICAEHFSFYYTGTSIYTNNKNYQNKMFFDKMKELMRKYDLIK